MLYHLHHQGRDLGTASLEELRRRRQAGELTGREFAWCDGLPDWRPLDEVLGPLDAPSLSPPAGPPALPLREAVPASTASVVTSSPATAPRGAARPGPGAVPIRRARSRRAVFWISTAVVAMILGLGLVTYLAVDALRESGVFDEFPRLDGAGAGPAGAGGFEEAGSALARDIASRPVAPSTNEVTQATVQRRARAFRERQWITGYKERADRSRPGDAESLRFLQAWLDQTYPIPGERPDTNAVPAEQLAARLDGTPATNDPLVLTLMALSTGDRGRKIAFLEQAVSGFETSGHLGYPRMTAAVELLNAVNFSTNYVALYRQGVEAYQRCFTDGSFLPGDQAEIGEILVHGWAYNFFYRMRSAMVSMTRRAEPEFSWLSRVLQGEAHVMEAWRQRGSGFAGSVSEAGWTGFSTNLHQARAHFIAAWEERPDLPLAPARLIYVALGDSGLEEMRQWFDRAVAAQIDYPDAWKQMRWGLRPRWHGDPEAMMAFGRTAAATKRYDTDVPRMLFDSVRDAEQEMGFPAGVHLYGRPDLWPHFESFYAGYLAEPTEALNRPGWHHSFAMVAFFAGRHDVARTQLEAIDWTLNPHQASGWGRDMTLMPVEVAARTGPLGEGVTAAELAFQRGDPAALEAYQALLRQANGADAGGADARTREFLRHRVAGLELERRLASGNWVPLHPDATNAPGWVVLGGTIRAATTNVLEVASAKFGGHLIYCLARLGNSFELRCEFEVVTPAGLQGAAQAGFALGQPTWDDGPWYAVRAIRNQAGQSRLSLARAWGARDVSGPATLQRGPAANTLHVIVSDDRITATLNGNPGINQVAPEGAMRVPIGDFMAGLSADSPPGSILRYRNFEARKR